MTNNIKQALQNAIECFEQSARGFVPYEQALIQCKAALSELEKAEPVYLARRIGTGLDYFTCNKQRFDNLNASKLFHTKIAFASPQKQEWDK